MCVYCVWLAIGLDVAVVSASNRPFVFLDPSAADTIDV